MTVLPISRLGSVEELVTSVPRLLALVTSIVSVVLCVVSVWPTVCVALAELAKIMLVMCGLWARVVLMAVLLFGRHRSILVGTLVLRSSPMVLKLTRSARLVGPVMMSPLAVSVVVIRLAKTVSGKPYGSTVMNMLWLRRNRWPDLLAGFGRLAVRFTSVCVLWVQQCRKLIVLWILVTVLGRAPLVLCMYSVTKCVCCVLTRLVVRLRTCVCLVIGAWL